MADFVQVAVPIGVRRTFTYSVPPPLKNRAVVGARVLIPFGRQLLTGIVVATVGRPAEAGFRVRPILDVMDSHAVLPPALVKIGLWVAEHYFTPPGEVLRALSPGGTQVSGVSRVRLCTRTRTLLSGGLRPGGMRPQQDAILDILAAEGEMTLKKLTARSGLRDASVWVEALAAGEWVQLQQSVTRARVGVKERLGIRALSPDGGEQEQLTAKQRRLYDALPSSGSMLPLQEVLRGTGCGAGQARGLARRGWVEIAPMRIRRLPVDLSEKLAPTVFALTAAQSTVFEPLRAMLLEAKPARCLLHGVTGSGKTEVYLRLIGEVLKMGGTAMLLVPEIGLTPLLSRIAVSHFPDRVALLHSGMSAGERFDEWSRVRAGAASVVVGTRSAVFAPLEKLRLIVIDEEQDASYKQDESPCYHAREVAWRRLQQSPGVLLMGSATPSAETFYAATRTEEVAYFNLPQRIESRPLAEVALVDMGLEFQRRGKKTVISDSLREALEQNFKRGGQAIILLNRRGYSRVLLCRSCGHVRKCPECSISLTYHQGRNLLICHYCGLEKSVPESCLDCGGSYIFFVGVGTEQLQEILHGLLPEARLARVDRDTTRRRGSLRKILLEFAAGRLDILVGTQMLAKGHDFPNVTLVGVLAADADLSFPDFRSAERTFQLLTQVAGRAGRGEAPGRVLIQAHHPDHYALQFARRQDYESFFSHELEFRRLLGYPPFKDLIQILVTDKNAEKAFEIGERIATAVKLAAGQSASKAGIRVLGPAPAPLEKLRGKYRVQVLLKVQRGENAIPALREAFEHLDRQKLSRQGIHVDVDPLSLL